MVTNLSHTPDFHAFVYWICDNVDEETISKLANLAERHYNQIDADPEKMYDASPDEKNRFKKLWPLKNSLEEFIAIAKGE